MPRRLWTVTLAVALACAFTLTVPSGWVASQTAGYSLRFHGAGVDDIDRAKIRVDDPATALPGPPVDVGATDFTIEFWLRGFDADNNSPSSVTCGANDHWINGNIVLDRDRFSLGRKFGLSVDQVGKIVFGVTNEGMQALTICGTTNVLDGRWHHVAVQRRSSDGWLWLFVDGQLQAQADGPDGDISYPDDATASYRGPQYCRGPADSWGGYCQNEPFLVLGAEKHDAGQSEGNPLSYPSFSGWLDELRISTVLRYAGAFTSPYAPFQTDAATVGLYHFDEGPAGPCIGALVDSSQAPQGPSNGQCFHGSAASAGPAYSPDTPPWTAPIPTPTSSPEPTATAAVPTATVTPTAPPTATAAPAATPTTAPIATAAPTAIPTAPPVATATPPPSPDAIFADGFEGGTLGAWSSNVNDGGDLSVSTGAALMGARGMQAVVDDNASIYVVEDAPNAERRYRARFYFDPNTIAMADGNAHYVLTGYAGASTAVLRVELRRSAGVYQLRAAARDDGTGWRTSGSTTISDAAHAVEVDWQAASGVGANDGAVTLWVDGAQRAALTGIDNDTRRIDSVSLGAVAGVDSETRGTYFFDAFESRRATYIGTPAGEPTPTQTPTPTPSPSANYALQFDGVDDVVSANRMITGNTFSVEAWVRPSVNTHTAIVIAEANLDDGWSLELDRGRLTLWVATGADWQSVASQTALTANTWHHVAGVYSNGVARVFVDGVLSGAATLQATFRPGPSFSLGGLAGLPRFSGQVDDVRVSRIARYAANFTPPSTLPAPDAATAGQWAFGEGAGQVTADSSPAANSAVLGASTNAGADDPAWVVAGR